MTSQGLTAVAGWGAGVYGWSAAWIRAGDFVGCVSLSTLSKKKEDGRKKVKRKREGKGRGNIDGLKEEVCF